VCGRYVRRSTRREIAAWFDAEDEAALAWGESYNVAPQSFQPVVRLHRETGKREIVLMRWGLIPYWSKDAQIGYSTINAKAETVATAPAFREAFKRRRCLVPADAFYEWQKLDPRHKQPFAIALTSREPYGFAGLWERWKNPAGGESLETFSIITTDANEVVAPLHNRMPVILARQDYARWLGGGDRVGDGAPPPLDLLRPFPAAEMTAWKVDKAVGNARNDTPQLLDEPATDAASTGLLF
jgi:putative SOS response-associated peptidase YedK